MDSIKVTINVDNHEARTFEGRHLAGSMLMENSKKGRRYSQLLLIGKASPIEIVHSMAATTAQAIAELSGGNPEATALFLQFFKDELKEMMKPGGYDITEHLNFLTKEEMEENRNGGI